MIKSCNNCNHLAYESPDMSCPYPQIWCVKGVFDGIASQDELDALQDETECKFWTLKIWRISE